MASSAVAVHANVTLRIFVSCQARWEKQRMSFQLTSKCREVPLFKMEDQCHFLRHIINILNFLFILISLSLIALGTYSHMTVELTEFIKPSIFIIISGIVDSTSQSSEWFSLPAFMITTGIVMFSLVIFGCYGTHTENKCVTFIYATLIAVITFALLFICQFAFMVCM